MRVGTDEEEPGANLNYFVDRKTKIVTGCKNIYLIGLDGHGNECGLWSVMSQTK